MKLSYVAMKKFCLAALLVSLSGCTSMEKKIDNYGSSWISRPLSELKQEMKNPDSYASKIGWDENTFLLANGYYFFIEPYSADCFIYWRINPQDRIVGYFPKGQGCATVQGQGTEPEPSVIEKFSPPSHD